MGRSRGEQAPHQQRLDAPTGVEVQHCLERALYYWLSESDRQKLLPLLQSLTTTELPLLDGISRIVVASNPDGKKVRALRTFLEKLDPTGRLVVEARDAEKPGGEVQQQEEVSVDSALIAALWKVARVRGALAGQEGGSALIIANDTIVFISDPETGVVVRLPNPERERHSVEAAGGQWKWSHIVGQATQVTELLSHPEGEAEKEVHVIGHCVTALERKARETGAHVVRLGYSLRFTYFGIPESRILADIERYRIENMVSAMQKRPPLVKLAEDYSEYVTKVECASMEAGVFADDLLPNTNHAADEGVMLRPVHEEQGAFYRPHIKHNGSGKWELQDVYGQLHYFGIEHDEHFDAAVQALVQYTQNGMPLLYQLAPEGTYYINQNVLAHGLDHGEVALLEIPQNVQLLVHMLLSQTKAFLGALETARSFMIEGVPPHAVLHALLATQRVPAKGRAREKKVMGYPEKEKTQKRVVVHSQQ